MIPFWLEKKQLEWEASATEVEKSQWVISEYDNIILK